MSDYSKSLGYTAYQDGLQECDACGKQYTPRPRAGVVEGSVLRSHRRTCPVNPQPVYTPGVCDA